MIQTEHLSNTTTWNAAVEARGNSRNMLRWLRKMLQPRMLSQSQAIHYMSARLINQSTFQEYYLAFHPRILSFFHRQGFNPEEAGELTQDVFVRAYTHLEQFQGTSEGEFYAWLKRITERVWKNKLRSIHALKRDGTQLSLDQDGLDLSLKHKDDDPLQGLIRHEQVAPLRAAISQLPTKMRQCLTLSAYHHYSYEEIGIQMKLSLPMVKNLIHQAKNRIQATLSKHELES